MSQRLLITEAELVNEQKRSVQDLLIIDGRISRIDAHISDPYAEVFDAKGRSMLPGLIDTHVHFRTPGYTEKATIATESIASLLGGVTSFLEMPNTSPPTTTYELLEKKYQLASEQSAANYGFYIGATEDNLDELLRMPKGAAAGLKIFMGSSTGSLLVENEHVLERLFSEVSMLIAVHCEDESIIAQAATLMKDRSPHRAADHPTLRPREGCLVSTQHAISLARKYDTQLHILHISSKEEIELLSSAPMATKHITAEACMHHLSFSEEDYFTLGNLIKVNPSIKTSQDQEAIWKALLSNKLDIIGSDHAPHTLSEKQSPYSEAPSGAPMVQFSVNLLLEAYQSDRLTLEQITEKCAHNPARRYGILGRGFIREGYHADLTLIERSKRAWTLKKSHIKSKCKWSPLEGRSFHFRVSDVFLSGAHVVSKGKYVSPQNRGQRLSFTSI